MRVLAIESDVLGLHRPTFLGLEELLPYIFVRCAEEVLQGPRLLRIELPHGGGPELSRKNTTGEHHLNHICEVSVFAQHVGDVLLQHLHLRLGPPIKTLGGP